MSKYTALWEYLCRQDTNRLKLNFAKMEQILGFPIDHSFLTYKKELTAYGWKVGKISMKNQTVDFEKIL